MGTTLGTTTARLGICWCLAATCAAGAAKYGVIVSEGKDAQGQRCAAVSGVVPLPAGDAESDIVVAFGKLLKSKPPAPGATFGSPSCDSVFSTARAGARFRRMVIDDYKKQGFKVVEVEFPAEGAGAAPTPKPTPERPKAAAEPRGVAEGAWVVYSKGVGPDGKSCATISGVVTKPTTTAEALCAEHARLLKARYPARHKHMGQPKAERFATPDVASRFRTQLMGHWKDMGCEILDVAMGELGARKVRPPDGTGTAKAAETLEDALKRLSRAYDSVRDVRVKYRTRRLAHSIVTGKDEERTSESEHAVAYQHGGALWRGSYLYSQGQRRLVVCDGTRIWIQTSPANSEQPPSVYILKKHTCPDSKEWFLSTPGVLQRDPLEWRHRRVERVVGSNSLLGRPTTSIEVRVNWPGPLRPLDPVREVHDLDDASGRELRIREYDTEGKVVRVREAVQFAVDTGVARSAFQYTPPPNAKVKDCTNLPPPAPPTPQAPGPELDGLRPPAAGDTAEAALKRLRDARASLRDVSMTCSQLSGKGGQGIRESRWQWQRLEIGATVLLRSIFWPPPGRSYTKYTQIFDGRYRWRDWGQKKDGKPAVNRTDRPGSLAGILVPAYERWLPPDRIRLLGRGRYLGRATTVVRTFYDSTDHHTRTANMDDSTGVRLSTTVRDRDGNVTGVVRATEFRVDSGLSRALFSYKPPPGAVIVEDKAR